jgi:hypothetical protein
MSTVWLGGGSVYFWFKVILVKLEEAKEGKENEHQADNYLTCNLQKLWLNRRSEVWFL